ncbi:hypothetical protein C8R44DRAFT_95570 [Mycena epipterygia]|nr:hypothetical protein C8R44DRAFT_95570 [Mycena epipterygia]
MTQHSETSKLLSSSSPPPVNQATRPTANTSGNGVLGTVRSVFQLVHGAGESFRGTLFAAMDDWENNGEQKHHEIARRGKEEIDEAYRQLRGTSTSSTPVQPPPTANVTGYDAAPPRYDATGVTRNGAGGSGTDSKNNSGM